MIITGLGNPGKEYENTRHNAGFWAIDSIARKFRVPVETKSHQALAGSFIFNDKNCMLVKPQTYMNLSGESVSGLMLEMSLDPEQLLVITDDINLPTGRIRLRSSGSDGGHNGLKSIISHIGKNFWRLRIGIGAPLTDSETEEHTTLVSHVLGSISPFETEVFCRIMSEIPDITALWLKDMGGQAMTKFNGKNYCLSPENTVPDEHNRK